MSKLATKLTILLVSSAVTGVAVWAVLRARRPPEDLRFASGKLVERIDGGPAPHVQPGDDGALDTRGVPALGALHPVFPPSTFRRWYLTPEEAGLLFGQHDFRIAYDPYTHFRYKPHLDNEFEWQEAARGKWRLVTNALGMREDAEVLEVHPDLRVLVAGDSHTDGICDNADSFANVLERLLAGARPGKSVEVLNAGEVSYNLYNYLGTLERFAYLQPDVCIVAVFGGNDFEEALSLYHLFQGTPRPGGRETYLEAFERAMDVHTACVGQEFNEIMYFVHSPDQIEVALQCARDVTTEIVATCRRNGIEPIFVYLPPPFAVDARWAGHESMIERMLVALDLKRDDMRLLDQMADSYVAFLESLDVSHVDMRPIYSTKTEQLYWLRDHHTSVYGHRVIAEALLPLVEAARPAAGERVRRPGGSLPVASTGERQALLSPGAPDPDGPTIGLRDLPNEPFVPPWKLALAGAYELPHCSAGDLARLVELDATREFDAQSWWRYKPKLDVAVTDAAQSNGAWRLRTNELGLRGAGEPAATGVDLRVIVTGDEQVVGACADGETCAARLASDLGGRHLDRRIECIDATCPGFGMHNYLGVFERMAALKPDAFVVCVSGGTDFAAALATERALRPGAGGAVERTPSERASRVLASNPPAAEQILRELELFREHPDDAKDAVRIAVDIVNELRRRCQAAGIQFVVVYLPPAHEAEWERCAPALQPLFDQLEFGDRDARATTRAATNFLSFLRAHGVEVIDMTPVFRQLPGPHFVEGRYVLGGAAQRKVAEFLRLSLEHRSPKLPR